MLLGSAYFNGSIGLFFNLDSIVIVVAGTIFFTISISIGRFSALLKGLKEIFSFRKNKEKDREVSTIFLGMTFGSVAVGLCSMMQGIISGALAKPDFTIFEIISISGFTVAYGILLSFFLWLPVYFRNK